MKQALWLAGVFRCMRGPPPETDLHRPPPHADPTLQSLGEGVPRRGDLWHGDGSDPTRAGQLGLQGSPGWTPRTQVRPDRPLTSDLWPHTVTSSVTSQTINAFVSSGWRTSPSALATAGSASWWQTAASRSPLSWRSTRCTFTARAGQACPCSEIMWRAAFCRYVISC